MTRSQTLDMLFPQRNIQCDEVNLILYGFLYGNVVLKLYNSFIFDLLFPYSFRSISAQNQKTNLFPNDHLSPSVQLRKSKSEGKKS